MPDRTDLHRQYAPEMARSLAKSSPKAPGGPSRDASQGKSLQTYRRKRRFQVTPEPTGGLRTKGLPRFTIQKHDATRLHYDFRLEVDGVLKSWAVPKGPSLNPADKRLAVRTEDHPLDYLSFEGLIPAGEYGGGPVIVWDIGAYLNIKSDRHGRPIPMARALEMGTVEVWLQGKKLQGGFALIRTRAGSNGKEQWLLIKMRDEGADPGHDVVAELPASALSGRTIQDLLEKKGSSSGHRGRSSRTSPSAPPKQPRWIEPMLATLAKEPPRGSGWIYEPKFDGFRALAFREGKTVRLLSRNEQDLAPRFPGIVKALKGQPVDDFILDGEIVALDSTGVPSFSGLQQRLTSTRSGHGAAGLFYHVFDLLWAKGYDTRLLPQSQRVRLLQQAISFKGPIRRTEQLSGDGPALLKSACAKGWEGLIAKDPGSPYLAGKRSSAWLKLKCASEQEFVIGGYTDPQGGRAAFGALLLGYYERKRLLYAGKVGAGLTDTMLRNLIRQLRALDQRSSPFAPDPVTPRKGVHFVKPTLVARVRFSEWTHDKHVRQPRFLGLRNDIEPSEVVRERPSRP